MTKLAPPQPTPAEVLETAVEMLNIVDKSIVYDIGCGRGDFIVRAAKSSKAIDASFVGIEYDEDLAKQARINANLCAKKRFIKIVHADATQFNFSNATHIFLYLVPKGLSILSSRLKALLEKNCRIVSYVFSVPEVTPVREVRTKAGLKLRLYTSKSLRSDVS